MLKSWRKGLLVLAAVVAPAAMFLITPRLGAVGLIALALAVVMAAAYRML